MNKEILISNTKLKIVSYPVPAGKKFRLPNKSGMKYQFVITVDKNLEVHYHNTEKVYEVDIPAATCYAIEKTAQKNPVQDYSRDDYNMILSMICGMPNQFLDTMEELCVATKDKNVIKFFYKAYSRDGMAAFKDFLMKLKADPDYKVGEELEVSSRVYKFGKRYSIYQLAKDLVNDHAKICIDQDLVGKYKRITASKTEKPEEIQYNMDLWQDVEGLIGNKSRANLSLQYTCLVDVEIPENKYGIKPGTMRNLKCIRTFNLVRDGVRNMPYIAVAVSKDLMRKLKGTKAVGMNLIYKNHILLDLSKLPVISRHDIKKYSVNNLAETEVQKYIADIAVDYYSRLANKQYKEPKKVKRITPAEKFLQSLGIYEDTYYPEREKNVKEGYDYQAVELQSHVGGDLPVDNFNTICTYIAGGQAKNKKQKSIFFILDNIKGQGKDLAYWSDQQKELQKKLRDIKFHLILSKNVLVQEKKKKPYLCSVVPSVSIFGSKEFSGTVKWNFKTVKVNV